MGQQTRMWSLCEAVVNIGTGMVVGFSATQFIAVPFLGVEITPWQNVELTILITILSVLRSYVYRRIFNRIALKRYKK